MHISTSHLDNRRDEFQKKAWQLQQRGVEVVKEVHYEPLDVGAIVILICHDHEVPVTQLLCTIVHLYHSIQVTPSL